LGKKLLMNMKKGQTLLSNIIVASVVLCPVVALAQGPGGGGPNTDSIVARMMSFDKNKDGKLTRDEVPDLRLQSLFDRADANKDGVVTKAELTVLFTREASSFQGGGRGGPGGPGGFGPGGPGGPGEYGPPPGGPGGFGGPGGLGGRDGRGFGGPPRPGQILPGFMQETLKLTDEQKKELDHLQKEVDSRLGEILTADQKKQLSEFRDRGPGGFRGPGGPGGFGPPPGGPGGFGGPGVPGDRGAPR
jgi:hypothetical protein